MPSKGNEQTRDNILKAFWSLYREKRIERITVKEITAKAGYNRGTFYEYFRDVHQCLDCIEALALPSLEELPSMPDGMPRRPESLEPFIARSQAKLEYYDVLLGERGDPSFERKLIEGIKAAVAGSGGIPDGIDALELDYMLEYALSGLIGVMRHYFRGRRERPGAEVMAAVYRSMGDGALRPAVMARCEGLRCGMGGAGGRGRPFTPLDADHRPGEAAPRDRR